MIHCSDISVVVQGPIIHTNNLTKKVVDSVRKTLVGAEIILSTWENENTIGLVVDITLKNIAPESFKINEDLINNVNLQIISTREGIKVATKKFILKLRSDVLINNSIFTSYFDKYSKYNPNRNYKLFCNRILAIQYYFRDPLKSKYLFHISDMILFGNKEDLFNLYDCRIAKEEDLINHTVSTKLTQRIRNSPEQYLWICFLNKNGIPAKINYLDEVVYKNFILSELTILNNFIILDPNKLKIELPERMNKNSISNLYTFNFWRFYRFLDNKTAVILTSIRYFLFQIKLIKSNLLNK